MCNINMCLITVQCIFYVSKLLQFSTANDFKRVLQMHFVVFLLWTNLVLTDVDIHVEILFISLLLIS